MAQETPAQPNHALRITGLDALRGLAALAVVLFHYTVRYQDLYGYVNKPHLYVNVGLQPVYLFFIISGFVILMTASKLREPSRFVYARFSRLYPAYWAAILVTTLVVLTLHLPGRGASFKRILVNTSMFQEFLGVGHVDPVYWSLQVELYFYLLVAVLLWRKRLEALNLVLVALMIVGLLDHLLTWHLTNGVITRLREVLLLHYLHLFGAGIAIYQLMHGERRKAILLLAACAMYVIALMPPVEALIYVGLAIVVFLAVTNRIPFLGNPVLQFLGLISYPLYLIHQNVGYALIRHLQNAKLNAELSMALAALLAIGLAAGITFAVERPVMKWLRQRRAPVTPELSVMRPMPALKRRFARLWIARRPTSGSATVAPAAADQ